MKDRNKICLIVFILGMAMFYLGYLIGEYLIYIGLSLIPIGILIRIIYWNYDDRKFEHNVCRAIGFYLSILGTGLAILFIATLIIQFFFSRILINALFLISISIIVTAIGISEGEIEEGGFLRNLYTKISLGLLLGGIALNGLITVLDHFQRPYDKSNTFELWITLSLISIFLIIGSIPLAYLGTIRKTVKESKDIEERIEGDVREHEEEPKFNRVFRNIYTQIGVYTLLGGIGLAVFSFTSSSSELTNALGMISMFLILGGIILIIAGKNLFEKNSGKSEI